MIHKKVIRIAQSIIIFVIPALLNAQNRIDQLRPDAPALAAFGEWQIGVKTLKFIHQEQMDVLRTKAGEESKRYSRVLTVEIWYPAAGSSESEVRNSDGLAPGEYRTSTRDPKRIVSIFGKALRDAPQVSNHRFPLVMISHGYPGNRYLLSHLGENLASKGYIVASIDHMESTYNDQAGFASTLLNRPLDILFVLQEIERLDKGAASDKTHEGFKGLIDTSNTGIIGYSMGGYGVVNVIGGGFTEASTKLPIAPPNRLLEVRQTGNQKYEASIDRRIKAAVAFAPWGWNAGFWDAQSLTGIKTPTFYIGGSHDDVSGYSPGFRNLFEGSVNAHRYLLTFLNANHNAGAPIPAPRESWDKVSHLPTPPASHYMDPVWDSVRMNNIAQHFVTAFLGKYLKLDPSMDAYLNLTEYASDGKWSVETDGSPKSDHTYWKGFQRRQASGLRLESKTPFGAKN